MLALSGRNSSPPVASCRPFETTKIRTSSPDLCVPQSLGEEQKAKNPRAWASSMRSSIEQLIVLADNAGAVDDGVDRTCVARRGLGEQALEVARLPGIDRVRPVVLLVERQVKSSRDHLLTHPAEDLGQRSTQTPLIEKDQPARAIRRRASTLCPRGCSSFPGRDVEPSVHVQLVRRRQGSRRGRAAALIGRAGRRLYPVGPALEGIGRRDRTRWRRSFP